MKLIGEIKKSKKAYIYYLQKASILYKYDFRVQKEILEKDSNASYVATKDIWEKLGYKVDEEKGMKIDNKLLYDISNVKGDKEKFLAWKYERDLDSKALDYLENKYDIKGLNLIDSIYALVDEKVNGLSGYSSLEKDIIVETTSFIILNRMDFNPHEIRQGRKNIYENIKEIEENRIENIFSMSNVFAKDVLYDIVYIIKSINSEKGENYEIQNERGVSKVSGRGYRGVGSNRQNWRDENGVYGRPPERTLRSVTRGAENGRVSDSVQQGVAEPIKEAEEITRRTELQQRPDKFDDVGVSLGLPKVLLKEENTQISMFENEEDISLKEDNVLVSSSSNETKDDILEIVGQDVIDNLKETIENKVFDKKDIKDTIRLIIDNRLKDKVDELGYDNLEKEIALAIGINNLENENSYINKADEEKEQQLSEEVENTSSFNAETDDISKIDEEVVNEAYIKQDDKIENQEADEVKEDTKTDLEISFDAVNDYIEELKPYLKEKVDLENNKDTDKPYISFSEYSIDLEGVIVTKELIDKLKTLDEKIYYNKTLYNNTENRNIAFYAGYFKTYFKLPSFDSEIRFDLGDGLKFNKDYYNELLISIGEKVETIETVEPSKIGLKVGYEFILVDQDNIKDISIKNTSNKVIVDNVEYPLFIGESFDDSRKIDKLMDSRDFRVYKLNEYLKNSEIDIEKEEKSIENSSKVNNYKAEVTDKKKNEKIDFHTDNIFDAEKLKPLERLGNNLEAIRIVKKLKKEKRYANSDEQKKLSQYVGFGGLSKVFENETGAYRKAKEELETLLTKEEFERVKRSTTSAFYTPDKVIKGMYKALEHLGFKSGKILEPSSAIGNFYSLMPLDMKNNSKLTAVEIDPISSKIFSALQPSSRMYNCGFEAAPLANDSFDVVIGNVPFGEKMPYDREYSDYKMTLHDYFIEKSIDKVRKDGIVILLTSASTMNNTGFLEGLSRKVDLVGAFKLPNDIFKDMAGTTVGTDILIFKKKEYEKIIYYDDLPNWCETFYSKEYYVLNSYFEANPSHILGEATLEKNKFGRRELVVRNTEDKPFEVLFEEAIKKLDKDIYIPLNEEEKEVIEEVEEEEYDFYDEEKHNNIENFSYEIIDDKVVYREDNKLYLNKFNNKKAEQRIRSLIDLRKELKYLINLQKENKSIDEIRESQQRLRSLYDKHVQSFDKIGTKGNSMAFSDDLSFPLLQSLEKYDTDNKFEGLADIFDKITIKPTVEVDYVDTALEGFIVSMQNKGHVDIEYIGKLCNKSDNEVIKELEGVIYKDVDGSYIPADEFFSGNMTHKTNALNKKILSLEKDLEEFSFSLEEDEKEEINKEILEYKSNLEKIKNNFPQPIKAENIKVQLGARWVNEEYYTNFIAEVILKGNYNSYSKPIVRYNSLINKYEISNKKRYLYNANVTDVYGVPERNALELIESALNMKTIKITKKETVDGETKSVIDKTATIVANQKIVELNKEFEDWIFTDNERRSYLEAEYNRIYNSNVTRKFDGTLVNPVGMNPNINLRTHQKNAIARNLYSKKNTLITHAVGAGKTYTMIVSAMEKKRLGLITKPLFVVPKSLVNQWSREFQTIYPTAKVLVTSKKEFEKKNRQRFFSKIATGNFDAIIMSHEQFGMIQMSDEFMKREMSNLIHRYSEFIANDNTRSFSIKAMQKKVASLEIELEKLNDMNKDAGITFEEMGIDALFVDEAHEYKNLMLETSLSDIRGINIAGNKKTNDMYFKTKYINEMSNYSNVTFATGTPVTNTLGELYSMMRYLQDNQLEEQKLGSFDNWVAQYGVIENSLDMTVDGKGFNVNQRFSSYKNLPELMNLWKDTADIVAPEDLNLKVPKANYHNVEIEETPLTTFLVSELTDRIDDILNSNVKSTEDNMLCVTQDGRSIALDPRLVNPRFEPEVTKTSKASEKIYQKYIETQDFLGTQLVFCDQSTPSDEFNVYDDLREKLVEKGIPKEEIKFIHEADGNEKKLGELFQAVRDGKVRVLIGSTRKMGQGMNVQDRLVALHHLDVPWRPADLEQREGRIIRQGNMNEEVEIYKYIAKGTFDASSWEKIIQKQKGIQMLFNSDNTNRTLEGFDNLVFEANTAKAIAIKNPLIKEKAEIEARLMVLEQLKSSHKKKMYNMSDEIHFILPSRIQSLEKKIELVKKDIEKVGESKDKDFSITLNSVTYTDKTEAGKKLLELTLDKRNVHYKIGEYKGFNLYLAVDNVMMTKAKATLHVRGNATYSVDLSSSATGNLIRLDNLLEKIPDVLKEDEKALEISKNRLNEISNIKNEPFKYEDEYVSLNKRSQEINLELEGLLKGADPKTKAAKKLIKNYLVYEGKIYDNISAFENNGTLNLVDEVINDRNVKVNFNLSNLRLTKTIDDTLVYDKTYDSLSDFTDSFILLESDMSTLNKERLIELEETKEAVDLQMINSNKEETLVNEGIERE